MKCGSEKKVKINGNEGFFPWTGVGGSSVPLLRWYGRRGGERLERRQGRLRRSGSIGNSYWKKRGGFWKKRTFLLRSCIGPQRDWGVKVNSGREAAHLGEGLLAASFTEKPRGDGKNWRGTLLAWGVWKEDTTIRAAW